MKIEFLQYYSTKQSLDTDNNLLILKEDKYIIKKLENYSDMNSIYQKMISSIIIDIIQKNNSRAI